MSCEVCQRQWERFLDVYNPNPTALWIFGTVIYTVLVVTIVSGLFMFMDFTGLPKSFRKYKIQPGTNEPLTWIQLKKVSLFNCFHDVFTTKKVYLITVVKNSIYQYRCGSNTNASYVSHDFGENGSLIRS